MSDSRFVKEDIVSISFQFHHHPPIGNYGISIYVPRRELQHANPCTFWWLHNHLHYPRTENPLIYIHENIFTEPYYFNI